MFVREREREGKGEQPREDKELKMELEYFDRIIFDYFDRFIFDKEWTKSGKQFKRVRVALLRSALPVCILPSLDIIRVHRFSFIFVFSLSRSPARHR